MSFNQYATIIAYIDDLAVLRRRLRRSLVRGHPRILRESPRLAIEMQILHKLEELPGAKREAILRQIDAKLQTGGV